MSPLNLVQLQCLDSVVREGSFRGAAAALSLSQPSVSMHVANLEQRLGVQLLKRSARGTSLTDAGKQMLPHLRSVLRAEEAARQQAISLRGEMEGRVRIGAVSGALSTVVPEAIHLTLDRYHTLTFEVFQMRGEEVQERVLDGTVDIGLIVEYTTAEFPDMRAELLTEGQVMFVAKRGHHLFNQDSVTLREVAAEPMVMLSPGHMLRERTLEVFSGYNLRIVGEADNVDALRRLVVAGVGTTLLPWMSFSRNPGVPSDLWGVPVSEIEGTPGLWMLHLAEHLSRAAEMLIDAIRETVPPPPPTALG